MSAKLSSKDLGPVDCFCLGFVLKKSERTGSFMVANRSSGNGKTGRSSCSSSRGSGNRIGSVNLDRFLLEVSFDLKAEKLNTNLNVPL